MFPGGESNTFLPFYFVFSNLSLYAYEGGGGKDCLFGIYNSFSYMN